MTKDNLKPFVVVALLALLASDVIGQANSQPIQLGARPQFLLNQLEPGPLKKQLEACDLRSIKPSSFSIGHRGAPLKFPEHTKESYLAAATMGAGILECDVTFTKDKQLVCRHAQCDLHETTDILLRPELASKCSQPFRPANPETGEEASARCCTSDITLEEFKTLCGKMEGENISALTSEEYINGTASWRTDLYSQCGTVMSHQESIELFKSLGTGFVPELKGPQVTMPYLGQFSQEDFADLLIKEYRDAKIPPKDVWLQSFNINDIEYWQKIAPEFEQRVFLDARVYRDRQFEPSIEDFKRLKAKGVYAVAPPIFALITVNKDNEIVPSNYATLANKAGLPIITWTMERSANLAEGGGFFYKSVASALKNDGDILKVLDVLASDVGVIGVFSDWPATTSFYAHCMDINK